MLKKLIFSFIILTVIPSMSMDTKKTFKTMKIKRAATTNTKIKAAGLFSGQLLSYVVPMSVVATGFSCPPLAGAILGATALYSYATSEKEETITVLEDDQN